MMKVNQDVEKAKNIVLSTKAIKIKEELKKFNLQDDKELIAALLKPDCQSTRRVF